MKTLYVTDLDGTLLNTKDRIIESNEEDGVAKWLKDHVDGK